MFLEVGHKNAGFGAYGFMGGPPVERKQTSRAHNVEDHHRAALDFVLELTGSPRPVVPVPVADKSSLGCMDSLVYADELPVAMFAVDLDMRCVFWNKRAVELSGWAEADISTMPRFTTALFSNASSCQKECEDILKGAVEGHEDSTGEVWILKTKWGQNMKVVLSASVRSDVMGAICGSMCVILPLNMTGMSCPPAYGVDCNVPEVGHLDLEEDNASPRSSEDQFLAALEHPPSPYSDRGVDAIDMFGDSGMIGSEAENTSVCSQDWCKSEQFTQSQAGLESGLETSSLTRARAMVVDPRPLGRKSLTPMLERCGFEVSCACSGTEALWRFEQSMQDPEGFSVIFINLSVARSEDYEVVRELRNMEQSDSSNVTPALIVAVTDIDRWEMSHMEDSTQKDLATGVDAVIDMPTRVQQLRDTLTALGVSIDHLDFANKSPRASFNSWNNPLILAPLT